MEPTFDELDKITSRDYPNIQIIIRGDVWIAGRPHSNVARIKMKLEQVTGHELELAVGLLEKEGLVLKTGNIQDYYGRNINTTGIKLKLPSGTLNKRGLAIELKQGKLEIVTDPYGSKAEVKQFKNTLTDAVKTVRMANGLNKMKYNVKTRYDQKDKSFMLVGVQH